MQSNNLCSCYFHFHSCCYCWYCCRLGIVIHWHQLLHASIQRLANWRALINWIVRSFIQVKHCWFQIKQHPAVKISAISAVMQPFMAVQPKKHANYLPKKFNKRKKNEVWPSTNYSRPLSLICLLNTRATQTLLNNTNNDSCFNAQTTKVTQSIFNARDKCSFPMEEKSRLLCGMERLSGNWQTKITDNWLKMLSLPLVIRKQQFQ